MTFHDDIPDGADYEALIFDWDGTLVDSKEVCFNALARSLAEAGVVLDPAWYQPRYAMGSPDLLCIWEQEFGPLPQPINEIVNRSRKYVIEGSPDLKIIESIANIARAASARGQKLAIATNAPTKPLNAALEATGLDAIFSVTATFTDVPLGRAKPMPDIYLLAAEKLSVEPAKCLVYEDAGIGIQAATSAGMNVYNVLTGEFLTLATVTA